MKIYSHFLLAKLAIPTATREIRDSIPGKQSENILRLASFPAMIDQESNWKQWKEHSGEEHSGKEHSGEGILRKPIHST